MRGGSVGSTDAESQEGDSRQTLCQHGLQASLSDGVSGKAVSESGQVGPREGSAAVTAEAGEPPSAESSCAVCIEEPEAEADSPHRVPSSAGAELVDVAEDDGGELSCLLVRLDCKEERAEDEVLPYQAAPLRPAHETVALTGEDLQKTLTSDGDVLVSQPDRVEEVDTSATSSQRQADITLQAAASDGDTVDSIKTFDLGERGPSAAIGCRATVYIGNMPVDTVVDTGAHRTLLSEAVYQRLRGLNCPEVGVSRPTGVVLRSASGDDCRISGVSTVTFSLNGESYKHPMYITAMGDVELLLGMDFLFAKQAVIDLKGRVLSLPGHNVPLRTQDLKSPLAARVKRAIEIQGGTQHLVQCDVLGDTELAVFDSYFEPAVALGPGVYLEPSLIKVDGACAGVVVSNYSSESVALDEGQILGMLTEPASGTTVGGVYAVHLWDGRDGTFKFKPEGVSRRSKVSKEAHVSCKTPHGRGKPPLDYPPTAIRHRRAGRAPGGQGPSNPGRAGSRGNSGDYSQAAITPSGGKPVGKITPGGGAPKAAGSTGTGQDPPPCPPHLLCTLPERSEVDLTAAQRDDAHKFLKEFEVAFTSPSGEVGQTDVVEHEIRLSDETPFKLPVRRLGPSQREVVQGEVQKVIDAGKVVPSNSPYASPVVLVRKKDGSLRLCIDYRQLNKLTVKDAFPLPRIDDSLDSLGGAKWFCTLDLASGYWQIRMAKKDMHKTAFITHMGLYEWLVMPFGLANAPATFGRMMAQILGDITYTKCLVYLDDVIVFGKTWDEVITNLRDVFRRLIQAGLRLKPSKCFLFRKRVQYLGHVVSDQGVAPDPNKIDAVLRWHSPQNLKELRAFLGLAGYYRRFVENFSRLADPFV